MISECSTTKRGIATYEAEVAVLPYVWWHQRSREHPLPQDEDDERDGADHEQRDNFWTSPAILRS